MQGRGGEHGAYNFGGGAAGAQAEQELRVQRVNGVAHIAAGIAVKREERGHQSTALRLADIEQQRDKGFGGCGACCRAKESEGLGLLVLQTSTRQQQAGDNGGSRLQQLAKSRFQFRKYGVEMLLLRAGGDERLKRKGLGRRLGFRV